MKFISLFLVPIILLINCKGASQEEIKNENDPIYSSMKKHADSLLMDSLISSVSIGIFKEGKSYTGHYGELDRGKGNVPTDKTVYEIASVSKTFAGALVAQAELDGKLSLDEDIRKYMAGDYPNFQYEGVPIRVRDLITHRSRLPRFLPMEINEEFENIDETLVSRVHALESNYSRTQFFKDLQEIEIDTIPGSRYEYSNVDTELMAHILENVYDKSYEDLLAQHLFSKIGMPDTKINLTEKQQQRLANGYGMNGAVTPSISTNLWGAGGGVKSTVPNLINYMKVHLEGTHPAIERSKEVIFEDEYIQTGFYWPIQTDEEDGTFYGHHGGAFGTQNWFFVIPKHNLGITVITNQSDMDTANKLMNTVNRILDDIR